MPAQNTTLHHKPHDLRAVDLGRKATEQTNKVLGVKCSWFMEMMIKMGCVKGHFIEIQIKLSVDIFQDKTIHQYVHFYKSVRELGIICKLILLVLDMYAFSRITAKSMIRLSQMFFLPLRTLR